MDDAAAYKAWDAGDRSEGPWEKHIIALDLMYNALDQLLMNSTQWNYTASNRNDQAVGDGWNQEDLSIYSIDQRSDPADINSGGRALKGFVRPYARVVAGPSTRTAAAVKRNDAARFEKSEEPMDQCSNAGSLRKGRGMPMRRTD